MQNIRHKVQNSKIPNPITIIFCQMWYILPIFSPNVGLIGITNNNLPHCSCQKICANTNVLEVHGAAADICHEEAALEDQEKGEGGTYPSFFAV